MHQTYCQLLFNSINLKNIARNKSKLIFLYTIKPILMSENNFDNLQKEFERIFNDHLKVEVYSKSIDSLLSPRSLNNINFSPYYQRNYVWDRNKATYFIESILLGTEIPPLIFFKNRDLIEVIDGRQRFETIIKFTKNEFSLSQKGLTTLTQLKNYSWDDFFKKEKSIIDLFLDAKIRIFEYSVVNEPPLDKFLEDRVKKEIFSRYNTGITPLKKSEVDNAQYDYDSISTEFKRRFSEDNSLPQLIYSTFFKVREKNIDNPPIEDIMSYIRRFLVLHQFPISYYARSSGRLEVLNKFYTYLTDSIEDEDELINNFFKKTLFISKVKSYSEKNNLKSNRLCFECLLWALSICENEEISISEDEILIKDFANFFSDNIINYNDHDYHFYKEIFNRYSTTAKFFETKYSINFDIYLSGSPEKRKEINEAKTPQKLQSKLDELETLRLNKPDPARNSIEDICRMMTRRRFLLRPSYQRKEVINNTKSSSIIESILLGISLPPIFVFKKEDGIIEVIDGQQRLLSILGFCGYEYIDENGKSAFSKNNKFKLKKLRILKELEGDKIDKLTEEQKNKILDFQLYLVEIEQAKNRNFDPIDLFIRLNDKPYPIREHSFEMWNSWVDFEIIQKIKELTIRYRPWFYVKELKKAHDRDRMENEELITSLAFLDYVTSKKDTRKNLDVYQIGNRINARIGDKMYITHMFTEVSQNATRKSEFFESLKSTISFIKKVKYIILDKDVAPGELNSYLKSELDIIFQAEKEARYFRRTLQDFYIFWLLVNDLNLEMVKFNRLKMKNTIKDIYKFIKNIPENDIEKNRGFKHFESLVLAFKDHYRKAERKFKLNAEEKAELIIEQDHKCSISGAPIFIGDDIEVDHTISLATGGSDDADNLKLAHKDDNRKKGAKRI